MDLGKAIGNQIAKEFLVAVALGVVLAFAVFEGLPWLWRLLRPVIHGLTA